MDTCGILSREIQADETKMRMKSYEIAVVKRLNRMLTGVRVRNQKFFVALLKEIHLVTDPTLFRPERRKNND